MTPINFESQTARSCNTQISDCNTLTFQDENNSQFDSLSHSEQEEQQKIKILEKELNEFFEISRDVNKQKMEKQRKRLMELFQIAEAEKSSAYRKLDFIRRQLIDLESNNIEVNTNDCDSGFHSKSENDQDVKILDTVRKRLRKLNDTNFELKKKVQKLEVENCELLTKLQSEKNFAQRNSETLREIADLLGGMTAKQFSYTDIYNKTSNERNPFCEAINGIKQAYEEREAQMLKAVGCKNQQIEELMINAQNYNEAKAARMNESLKCQINNLRRIIAERDRHIMNLTGMLKGFSHGQSVEPHQAALEYVTSRNNFTIELERKNEGLKEKLDKSMKQELFLHKEARKLNEELNETKKKNADLMSQVNRLGALLKSQEVHRMELAEKYETLESNYEEQEKQLRTANNQLCLLNERFQCMEKRQFENNMENSLLREEILSLKEKQACGMGTQKSLREQLLKTEKELFTAHNVIKEQQNIMQRNELNYKEIMQRTNEINAELKRKYNELIEDYKKLQDEHDKQKEINNQQSKLIENYNKWKEQQLKAESRTRGHFKQLEDFNKSLLEERQIFLDHYWDCTLQQSQLDRLKLCLHSLSGYNCNSLQNPSEKSIAERLEIVHRTTRRVSEQSSSFKDDETLASTPVIPSDEPL